MNMDELLQMGAIMFSKSNRSGLMENLNADGLGDMAKSLALTSSLILHQTRT